MIRYLPIFLNLKPYEFHRKICYGRLFVGGDKMIREFKSPAHYIQGKDVLNGTNTLFDGQTPTPMQVKLELGNDQLRVYLNEIQL